MCIPYSLIYSTHNGMTHLTKGITRSLHVFCLLFYCSDVFPPQFLTIFRQLASLSTYTAHVVNLRIVFVEAEIGCLTFRCKHRLRAFREERRGGSLDLRRHKWQQSEESCIMQRTTMCTVQRNFGRSEQMWVGHVACLGVKRNCIQRFGRNARRNEAAWNAWAQLCGWYLIW
jgi:hypothetical protein